MMLFDEWQDYLGWRYRFAAAIDPRFYPMGWLDGEVWAGRARFWSNEDAAVIAALKVYPTGARAVHGLVAAGGFEALRPLVRLAEIWGAELGCIASEIDSRPGWARAMRDEGYTLHQTCLRKEL